MKNRPENSRLLRYCVSSLQCSLNVTSEEHIRRILTARLNGIARLVCKNRIARRGRGGGGNNHAITHHLPILNFAKECGGNLSNVVCKTSFPSLLL